MKNLSHRLVSHILMILIASMTILATVNLYNNKKILTQKQIKENESQASIISNNVNSRISELRNDALFLSATPPIQGILRAKKNKGFDEKGKSSEGQWKDRLETIFKEMLIAKSHYLQIRYISHSDNGKEMLRVERIGSRIERTKEVNLQEKKNEDYYQEVFKLTENQVYLSPFSLNREYGKVQIPYTLVLRAAVPIYEKFDTPFGFIIINMDYTGIFRDISEVVAENTEYFVTDSNNNILLHSNRYFNAIDANGKFTKADIVHKSLPKFFKSETVSEMTKTVSLTDKERLIIASKIHYNELNPNDYLGVALISDIDVITGAVRSGLLNEALILFLIVLAATLLSFIYINKQLVPLRYLKTITSRFDQDKDFSISEEDLLKIEGQDEVAELSRTLLHMSKEIGQQNILLNSQKLALDSKASVSETDTRGIITYVNDKFCKLTGYEREELIGRTHKIINSNYHDEAYFKQMWETILAGDPWEGVIRNKAKDGSFYWVDSIILPIKDDKGEILKFISIRMDITELVDQRQKMAEATETKSRFLATMSHEIRTPLNGVLGMLTLLEEENLSEEGKKNLATMKSSGLSLLQIINDILDFSKMEAHKLHLESIGIDLYDVVQEPISLLYSKAKENNTKIDLIFDDNCPQRIVTDPIRLKQILLNLLSNAIKFTKNGTIEIHVKAIKTIDQKFTFQFAVKDSGIGIDADSINHLFSPFTQADTSTTRRFGGTGLGLTICKGIVEMLNGNIWAESKEGEGSTFFFTLEAIEDSSTTTEEEEESAIEKEKPQEVFEKKEYKILIADDNKVNQIVARKFLQKLGYQPDVVDNGQEAYEAQVDKSYDIIFMDGHMPILDGYEATVEIRKEESSIKQPWIIALTASTQEEDKKRCIDSGMNDFIPKPLTIDTLKEALKRVEKL
ncbi:ATP-binding protein [Halobacteriovorax sp. GB3]|uniref:ATP-binding protein n=1 Tax=Halobacteriovorax sp. GB3 TaxID=2719615 RepID=UPI00235F95C6|nr:ATP-binding protein [Halobacteriovorax sp. GB3]MDD0854158.1 ATP-binding protein [Halobacteriovorax sp. GB3]